MLINLKVKTLDARTHVFSIDNELTIRQFKDQIAEKTNIAAENQRIIYQGRVLPDDKQVKEFDVDGKVLHVAERPPFSLRGANATNNDEPVRIVRNMAGRPAGARNLRNSPYFRALDGMLVGTMAIPVNNGTVNAGGARTPPNRFPNSSSFCINRITVALHMIDCANNIAAYLENPEVGLNNQSLDILQRGRWTMESTVVEVGVSSTDMPRNNNIIDIVQDAVTAALSRNTPGRNYTVVQLPTVYTNEGGEGQAQRTDGSNDGTTGGTTTGGSDTSEVTTSAGAVIIEDVIETDDEAADGSVTPHADDERSASPPVAAEAGPSNAGDAAAAAAEDNGSNVAVTGIGPRRRTRPQVLANVIERYRNVQTRISPFVERYYEILNQDPVFAESDNVGRENAQRIFDRVSEAFHYLSHAQHAISDLMLDLSQPGPRVLTCRPILVEQSGYIRSNNIFTPNMVGSPLADLIGQTPPTPTAPRVLATAATNAEPIANSASSATSAPRGDIFNEDINAGAAEAAAAAAVVAGLVPTTGPVEDPVDEPMVVPIPIPTAGNQQQPRPDMAEHVEPAAVAEPAEAPRPRFRLYMPVPLPPPNPQVQMARLIQAVVNSATNDADFRVEFNMPNVMSFNLPVHLMTAAVHPQGQTAAAATDNNTNATAATGDADVARAAAAAAMSAQAAMSASAAAASAARSASSAAAAASAGANAAAAAASTSSGTRSGEQRANTLPTTATQTRSTARPQIQIGGNNNWAGRITPTHTAFDRFLPCNSHHIREPEPLAQAFANNNNNVASGSRRLTANSGGSSLVIASRLQRGQSNANLPRLLTRRRFGNGNLTAGTGTLGGVGSRARWPTVRPLQRTISRLISNMFHNYLVTNMRNHAQTALGGTGVGTLGGLINANANATSSSSPSPAAAAAAAISSTVPDALVAAAAATTATSNAAAAAGATTSVRSSQVVQLVRDASNLRAQLYSFLHHSLFADAPINEETMPAAIGRALEWFGDSLVYLPQYEQPEYNSRDSVCNTLRQSLRLFIDLCSGNETASGLHFEQQLKQICEQFRKRLYSVLLLCLGTANAELYWRQLMRLLCAPLRSNFRNEALQFLCIYIDPTIPAHTDTADAQQFLVLRSAQSARPTDADTAVQSLDTDVEMTELATGSSSSISITELEPPLPAVNVGSEPWHNSFPNDWLPVIARDLQTQTEQNRPQPPYSDAYISGMSAKRRKIIQTEKPSSNVECLIASGVQRAIQSTGLSPTSGPGGGGNTAVNSDAVIGAIAHDAVVQASYTDAMRNNVRERLKQDVDYKPSKYPQIAKFTEQK